MGAPTAFALPAPGDFSAPASWSAIDLISDLHLAPDMPLTCAAWEAFMLGTPADAVFILGDLFDVWVGDDARHQGFEARCADVLARAAARCRVGFMAGNRDFLLGAQMMDSCGLVALTDPTVLRAFGQRVLLSHGDALCLSDAEYQRYRAQVRSPQWQTWALSLPLEERRRAAAQMRRASEQRNADGSLPQDWSDIDAAAALAWMGAAATPVLVHGHTHQPATEPLAPGAVRHVLADWDLDHVDGRPRAQVLRFTRDGFTRLAPNQALQIDP